MGVFLFLNICVAVKCFVRKADTLVLSLGCGHLKVTRPWSRVLSLTDDFLEVFSIPHTRPGLRFNDILEALKELFDRK